MRTLVILSTILLLIGCANNQKKETSIDSDSLEFIAEPGKNLKKEHTDSKANTQTDTSSCDKTALVFLKLADKNIQADFFRQLDSIRKFQYPKNDQDTTIFVDLTPMLLDKFLRDLNKDQLATTGNFEKAYDFNIAPPKYADSKKCKDKISITFEKSTCSFRLVIHNEFFADWCQESMVVYGFKINGDKISDFGRNEAGVKKETQTERSSEKPRNASNYYVMIRVLFLAVIFLLHSSILFAQHYNKKYFKNTDWFSNNKDSAFYTADTLKLIKHSNYGPEWLTKEYAENESSYLHHGDFVKLSFHWHKKMSFSWRFNNSMGRIPGGQWTWTFDKKSNLLNIYDNNKALVISLRPISQTRVKIQSRFEVQKDLLNTTELTLVRMK